MTVQTTWPRFAFPNAAASELKIWRMAWADPEARAIWEPRMKRLMLLVAQIEQSMIVAGELDAAVLRVGQDDVAAIGCSVSQSGLVTRPIAASMQAGPRGKRGLVCDMLICRPDKLDETLRSLERPDATTAAIFGAPACCAAYVPSAPFRPTVDEATESLVHSPLTLLAGLGLGPLRHYPCAADCKASADVMRRFLDLVSVLNREAAIWYDEMLGWDVHWSRKAGIVEIRTPAFRYAYPEAGPDAIATAGPARILAPAPKVRPSVRRAVSVVSGALDPDRLGTTGATSQLNALTFDGFDCAFAQRYRFAYLVWRWAERLRGNGEVMHLPCGGGALLELVKEVNPRLRLLGYDKRKDVVLAAQRRLNGSNVLVGELEVMMRELRTDRDASGRTAFVDPEHLIDMPVVARRRLIDDLVRSFDVVIMYANDRMRVQYGSVHELLDSLGVSAQEGAEDPVSAVIKG